MQGMRWLKAICDLLGSLASFQGPVQPTSGDCHPPPVPASHAAASGVNSLAAYPRTAAVLWVSTRIAGSAHVQRNRLVRVRAHMSGICKVVSAVATVSERAASVRMSLKAAPGRAQCSCVAGGAHDCDG